MTTPVFARFFGVLMLVISTFLSAQEVHRCQLSDGSITFSDSPCESDTGKSDTVDATPHQGHRAAPPLTAYSVTVRTRPESGSTDSGAPEPVSIEPQAMSRVEKAALQRERKRALATLRNRHLSRSEKQANMKKLRQADARLGISNSDIESLPPYDRRVYEAHNVHSTSAQAESGARHSSPDAFQENHEASQHTHELPPNLHDVQQGELFINTGANMYHGTQSGEPWIQEGTQLRNLRTNERRDSANPPP